MIPRPPLLLARLIALPCLFAVSAAMGAPAPRPPNESALRAVAAGQRAEVRASWWGFDPVDATAALQAAINSGAKRLVIENLGAPWITDGLQLASDQEIVFSDGVVVQAKRGAFQEPNASLFSATSKRNITLTGHGATLRMWKQDYDDKAKYKHAEWRHVLNFKSCAGVRVTGLTLADSGGDGIYLGVAERGVPCSDFVIKDVKCLNNYRQGISVISARNLLIEDCVLQDTGGTAPQAGIDFEPNHPSEELVNCVMRNCVSANNRGDAYVFYLRAMRADSKPISIRLENCRALGGRSSARFTTGNHSENAGVKGTMEFINCRFEGSEHAGVAVGDKPLTGARVRFVDCEIINAAANQPALSPILLSSRADGTDTVGGIQFVNCVITDRHSRLPMSYQDMSGGVGLRDITGTLVVVHQGRRTTHQLTPELITAWMPHRSFKQIMRLDPRGLRFEPARPEAKLDARLRNQARQRGLSEWLVWGETGQKVTFTVSVRPVGKADPKPASVSLLSPSGQLTKLAKAEVGREIAYEFTAAETGAHKIVCEPQNFTATVNSATHRVCLFSESTSFHFLGTTGRYFFWVPAGTKEFAIKVAGENAAEGVKVALCDPAGNKVEEKDNITQAHQFVAAPGKGAQGEIWSLRFDRPTTGVLEDFHVQLQGVPPLLAHTKESLLKPAK